MMPPTLSLFRFPRKRKSSGFTLVELAIVLVIIGLLIGGILVARSMIATSKISAQVKQIQQFDAGVANFETKYNSLPGDSTLFGGDGDGVIDLSCGGWTDDSTAAFDCENANFWGNLFPNEYVTASTFGSGAQVESIGTSKNVPLAKMGKKESFILANSLTIDGNFVDTDNKSNFYGILDATEQVNGCCFTETDSTNSALTPAELLALDKKIDDGIANAGNVRSGNMKDGGGAGFYFSPLATCSSGATYVVANSGYECTPLIRIGGQTGDPQ